MARRNQSQFSRILKRLIGKDSRKPSRRDAPGAKRSLRAEQLEARRVFAGLVFDSVAVAGNDSPVNSTRLPAVQTVSPMAPPVDGNQKNSTESLIAGAGQRKALIGYDSKTVQPDLQAAASHREDQRPLPHANVQAERSKAKDTEESEENFFLEDSFDVVDDALLSLLAQR